MTDINHRNPVLSVRVGPLTRTQLDELAERWGMSLATAVTVIVDRAYREERTMNAQIARKLAVESVEYADAEGYPVADTTMVGTDPAGMYWVADNGEEVVGLTKEQAVEIIVENLTAE